ncbi:hypothetical protein [Clostridium sp.]|uniref:hypothetical protein n=1 Tax=Clostridium sp. TaxID=1506 RepID=UPI00261F7C19|nr:hypothetical protein [uncultured Clostridium sp.]
MNIIKTAILTILISFASGLLLDYYKNLGSRILCNIRKGKPTKTDSEENCGYVVTVKNPSNRTIHELTINIGSKTKLRSKNAKITRGLKFDSTVNDSTLEVYIPFIGKGDEFSVTVYLEDQDNKPVIVIKSPENFKEIYSGEENGILALLFNIPTNIKHLILKKTKKAQEVPPVDKEDFTAVMSKVTDDKQTINKNNREVFPENKKLRMKKKKLVIILAIILVMIVGVSGEVYSKMNSKNETTPTVKTVAPKQSTGTNSSTEKSTGNTSTKKSTKTDSTKVTTPDKTTKESGTPTTKTTTPTTPSTTPTPETPTTKTPTTPKAGATDGTKATTPTKDSGSTTTPPTGSDTTTPAKDSGTTTTPPATTTTTPTTKTTTGN